MSAPLLQPLGTPAAEWAQQTVQAINPNASTGLVTDVHGNPTTDHSANAIAVLLIMHTSWSACALTKLFGTSNLAGLVGTFNFLIKPSDLAGAPIVGLVLSAAGGNWHASISFSGRVQVFAVLAMAYDEWAVR
ncbi:hypothetical protein FRC09_013188 [Ceratobasidium sp. 395]|nr:hypothetical protein FRC09_013188 [Ceratobasidium sp. 395]